MIIEDVLSPAHVLVGHRAPDKRRLLRDLSQRAGEALGLAHEQILGALLAREQLGSTGMGEAIALPHARLPAIERPFGSLAVLKPALAFESIDDQPVDVVFLLLLPAGSTGEHLALLAAIARRLRDRRITAELRRAWGADEAFSTFVAPMPATVRSS